MQDKVKVTVLAVDIPRKRISLSLKSDPFGEKPRNKKPEKRHQKPKESMEDKLSQLRGKFK